jgi:hypothetical protein
MKFPFLLELIKPLKAPFRRRHIGLGNCQALSYGRPLLHA